MFSEATELLAFVPKNIKYNHPLRATNIVPQIQRQICLHDTLFSLKFRMENFTETGCVDEKWVFLAQVCAFVLKVLLFSSYYDDIKRSLTKLCTLYWKQQAIYH
jgi:hypothetical protein